MKLKELHGKNRWCGPSAVSFITGLSTDDVSLFIRNHYNRRKCTGTYLWEIGTVLNACGYALRPLHQFNDIKPRWTLARWLKESKDLRTSGRVFLVDAGNHWQLVTGRRYACGIAKEIVSIKHPKVKRRARVAFVAEIIPQPHHLAKTEQVKLDLEAHRQSRQKATRSRADARSSSLSKADKHNIDIEVDDFGGGNLSIYLFPPDSVSAARENGQIDYDGVVYSWEDCDAALDELIRVMIDFKVSHG